VFILLPAPPGEPGGAIVVTNPAGTQELRTPDQAVTVERADRAPGSAFDMDRAEVQRLFGEALAAQPAEPARFVVLRVLCRALARHPRFREVLTRDTIELLANLAPIHDIGKVGVPDRLLRKPGPLTAEEYAEMRMHPVYGRDVIARAQERVGIGDEDLIRLAKEIVYSHHERWDGMGYPLGLAGDAIPVAGRLIALVDVYDALVSERVYKRGWPHEEVVELILAGRGTQFDPDVVDAFLRVREEWRRISIEFADEPEAPGAARPIGGRAP
jgi:response regulator RpfG family c-di-GMP phosphodiesterase